MEMAVRSPWRIALRSYGDVRLFVVVTATSSPILVKELNRSVAVRGSAAAVAVAVASPAAAVVASQHSNARIEKSNRRSKFGQPLGTNDCEENDDLCKALSPELFLKDGPLSQDTQSAEIEDLPKEDSGNNKGHRKVNNYNKGGAKRLDGKTNLNRITPLQKRATGFALKKRTSLDEQRKTRVRPTAPGVRVPSLPSTAHEFRGFTGSSSPSSRSDALLMTDTDDSFWEEKAYQIIRQQKQRVAALAAAKAEVPIQPARGLADPNIAVVETLPSTARDGDNLTVEDVEFRALLERLGLEDKNRPLIQYLQSLGLREKDLAKILDRHKASLQANATVVKERVDFLLTVGVQSQHLRKVIVRHPQILEYRVEQAMKPRVNYLKSLGLDEAKIAQTITVAPSLLECSLQRSIKPRVTYLVEKVGIRPEDVGKVVTRSPQILTQSIDESLEPRLNYFLNELKVPRPAFAKMATRHPQLFHYSIEDGLRPRVKYLTSLGMSNDDVINVLIRLTQILSLSVEKCLRPKYSYLVEELKGDVHTITSFPAYFSLSLDQRIVPRHKYLQFLEKAPYGPFPMKLLAISDVAFCEGARTSVQAYEKFRHDQLLSNFARNFERKNNVKA